MQWKMPRSKLLNSSTTLNSTDICGMLLNTNKNKLDAYLNFYNQIFFFFTIIHFQGKSIALIYINWK